MNKSSFPGIAEQILIYNKNVVDILSKINQLMSSTDSSIPFNIIDKSGISTQFNVPSFGYLKSEIDRLNNNIQSIYNINDSGSLIQTAGTNNFKKIVTVDLNKEPNNINQLSLVQKFKSRKNWFFDGLLNPELFIEMDLSGQVENNVRKCLVRRYIVDFAKNADGSYTSLGQSALNSFNATFRNQTNIRIEEFERWHKTTSGIVEPLYPNYDEQIFDMDPNELAYDGVFSVLNIEEDTINRKLWYNIDTLQYSNTQNNQTNQLSINDELIVNQEVSNTRYKVIEISTISSNPKIRLERIEGNQPISVGIGTLKIYSPVLYNKTLKISISYNERNVVFVKALNSDNNIMSKNWSLGSGYWSNDLKLLSDDSDNGTLLEQYYINRVYDYGEVLQDLVAKKIPNRLAGTPNAPSLSISNFKVVQINKHLTVTADSNLLLNYHNQQISLKSEIIELNDTIDLKNKELKISRSSDKVQFSNQIDALSKLKESKSKMMASVVSDIIQLSKSPISKVEPKFALRGFWSMPEAVITRGTAPQEIVQFRVKYRYLSKDGTETPIETFKIITPLKIPQSAAFTNWVEFKSDVRQRTLNESTGEYTWKIQDISDADTPNINQLDIPIKYGEKVEIMVKSISEVGWPDAPVESDWSDPISIEFPDDLNNVLNENDFILREASKEDIKVSLQSDLSAKGLDDLLSQKTIVGNKTYFLGTDTILSGFTDENGLIMALQTYLQKLENRVSVLEEKIKRARGEMEVVVYRNQEQFVVKNNGVLEFVVECEDYLDSYSGTGVPTGRVYVNKTYVIKDFLMKVRNKSLDSPLGLLSNRLYNSSVNSDVYNSSAPQTFWVNDQHELIYSNITGESKTQLDNQFIWMTNYDNLNQTNISKLSNNIGNDFINDNSNSITDVLSSDEYNIGYSENSILNFIGNNNSLTENSKWIDKTPSVSSTNKLLSSIHPVVSTLDKIVESNSDKIKVIDSGTQNDIDIPICIYFKMNALDNSQGGLNSEWINLNSSKKTIQHIKKIKFLIESEVENRPFVFTIKFTLNRNKAITKKNLAANPTLISPNFTETLRRIK